MAKIKGGYYIKARCIRESEIAKAPPHVREIWDWLFGEANHKDYKNLKRGQVFTSYKEILNALSWFVGYRKMSYTKSQCETAMKWLTKRVMVTTTKTTRGMIVTICNYSYYQDPKNYENHTETDKRTTTEPQWHDTINKNGKNEKKVKKEKNKEYSLTSDEVRLSQLLFSLIRIRDEKHKEPDYQKWAIHIDRLNRLDERSFEDIEAVIKWSQNDSFWQANILSTSKLREKFSQLKQNMEKPKVKQSDRWDRLEKKGIKL